MNVKKWEKAAFISFWILLLLAAVSLVFPSAVRFREKKFRTAFFSGDNVPKIQKITLSGAGISLSLEKTAHFWRGELSDSRIFLADAAAIQSFLNVLSKIRDASVVSERAEHWQALGVDEASAFAVRIAWGDDFSETDEVFFGKEGVGNSRISFRAGASARVFQTENDISSFLQTDPSFWASPYVLSREGEDSPAENLQSVAFGSTVLFGTSLLQKADSLLSLRRGLVVAEKEEAGEASAVLSAEFVDGKKIQLSFFEGDELFFVKTQTAWNDGEKIVFWYEISRWTFDKISEIFLCQ